MKKGRKYKMKLRFQPYKGVFLFYVVLFTAHFFWKYTVLGDESDELVTFFGMNISAIFDWMTKHVASFVYTILSFLGYNLQFDKAESILSHGNGMAIRIVWACTGLKQAYIFFCILIFAAGPFSKKIWFLPLGLLVVYFFNIFRIAAIVAIVKQNPTTYVFWHEYFFKYAFYGVIFLMWLFWEEKVRIKKST